jgi:hypothetical protein
MLIAQPSSGFTRDWHWHHDGIDNRPSVCGMHNREAVESRISPHPY